MQGAKNLKEYWLIVFVENILAAMGKRKQLKDVEMKDGAAEDSSDEVRKCTH